MYSLLRLKSLHSFRTLPFRDNATIFVVFQTLLGKATFSLFCSSVHNLCPRSDLTSLVWHLYFGIEYFAYTRFNKYVPVELSTFSIEYLDLSIIL